MNHAELQRLQSDPELFRANLQIEAGRLGAVLDDWQDADFRALDPGWRRVVGQSVESAKQRAMLIRPRGHSKSSDIATMLTWCLFASPNRLRGIVAAVDVEQAELVRSAVQDLLSRNPWLQAVGRSKGYLTVTKNAVENLHTGSRCEFITSDVASSFGHTPDFIVCDELSHWPKDDLWLSLFSSAGKRQTCMVCCIMNAGFRDSWQWDLVEAVRQDPNWYFHSLDGPQASWISKEVLEEQKRLLPQIAFDRLWMNRWGEGAGDAFAKEDIDRLTTLSGPLSSPQQGWAYCAGVDLGVKHDSSSVVIVARHVGRIRRTPGRREDIGNSTMRALCDLGYLPTPRAAQDRIEITPATGRLQVCRVKVWTPTPGRPVDLRDVEDYIVKMNSWFGLQAVCLDPWQAEQMGQRLRAVGMRVVQVPATARQLDEMARLMLDAVSEQRIEFYDDPTLRADLLSLRVEERANSQVKLTAPRQRGKQVSGTRHADTASALQLALYGSRRLVSADGARERPLVLHPL